MKKFLASLLFLSFFVVSQMQIIHAFDMNNMLMGEDMKMEKTTSIFCTKTAEKKDGNCIQEVIPNKSPIFECIKEIKISTLSFCTKYIPVFSDIKNNTTSAYINFFYLYKLKSKSSYRELVWVVVKNLN